MKELVEYIANSLVSSPEQVKVEVHEGPSSVMLELHVASVDMGRVIGRQGRVVNAIRTLLRVMGTREGVRVNLDIG